MFTARFYYVSHGNATITCYEETFRELGAVKLSPSANRKPLRYENKPRTGASSIVACLVLTFSCHISACKFMHSYFSFDLSTNYAGLDVTTVDSGGRLRERL